MSVRWIFSKRDGVCLGKLVSPSVSSRFRPKFSCKFREVGLSRIGVYQSNTRGRAGIYRSSKKGFKSKSTCSLILKQMKTLRTKFFLLLSIVCQMDSGFQKNSGICSCISESATAQKIDEIWKTNKAKGVKYLEHLIQLQKGARPTVISHSLWSERRQKYARCGREGH